MNGFKVGSNILVIRPVKTNQTKIKQINKFHGKGHLVNSRFSVGQQLPRLDETAMFAGLPLKADESSPHTFADC
jgi:hypothetical protein